MNIRKNEFLIGTVMITMILLLIFGVFWLGNSDFFVKGLPINAKLENANGISKGDIIYYRGLKVGTVRDAKIKKDAVILELKIDGYDEIPSDSKFVIKNLSIIGGKIIEIIPGNSSAYLQKGDTVKAFADNELSGIVDEFKELKPQISKILKNADILTGKETYKELLLTIRDLHSTIKDTKTLINGKLAETVSNLNKLTMDNSQNISNLLNSLSKNSNELSTFLNHSSSVAVNLDSILEKINNGNGTAAALMNNDSLYRNLNNTIKSIDSLVSDLKRNPKKYINVSVF